MKKTTKINRIIKNNKLTKTEEKLLLSANNKNSAFVPYGVREVKAAYKLVRKGFLTYERKGPRCVWFTLI